MTTIRFRAFALCFAVAMLAPDPVRGAGRAVSDNIWLDLGSGAESDSGWLDLGSLDVKQPMWKKPRPLFAPLIIDKPLLAPLIFDVVNEPAPSPRAIEKITVEGGKVEIIGDTIKIEGGKVEILRRAPNR